MMKKLYLSITLLLFALTQVSSQTIIEVPTQYATIQEALDAAESNTMINVLPGTYKENIVWPEDVDSLTLIGVGGRDETIIDGGGGGRVLDLDSWIGFNLPKPFATIIGFTIKNGFLIDGEGGGINIYEFDLNLKNLIIEENEIQGERGFGGGVYLYNCSGIIQNCIIRNNVLNTISRSSGGGINISQLEDNLTIKECEIFDNSANTNDWAYGGGIYADFDISTNSTFQLKLISTSVSRNTTSTSSWSYGAGVYFGGFNWPNLTFNNSLLVDSCIFEDNSTNTSTWSSGGGIYISEGKANIINSKFTLNSSEEGSAIYISRDSEINLSNCDINNNNKELVNRGSVINLGYENIVANIRNTIIGNNKGSSIVTFGSGSTSSPLELNLEHCTIYENEDGISIRDGILNVVNSILWNNSEDQIIQKGSSDVSVSYSIVKGGFKGQNIIDVDPAFISSTILVPSENSPCLNAGIDLGLNTDILGNPRPIPLGSYPDIGAYEIDQYFAYLQAKFYFDENENGQKDNAEKYFTHGSINVNNEKNYINFRDRGIYVIVDQGPLSIVYEESWSSDWYCTTNTTFTFDVNTEDFSEVVNFGLAPNEIYSDLFSSIVSDNFRCGEEVEFTVFLTNDGTVPETGTLYFTFDERVTAYRFDQEPDEVVDEYTVGWYFDDLYPSETISFDVYLTAPIIDDESQVGENYTFKTWTSQDLDRNIFCYDTEIRCAFDPNDKLVHPNRSDNLALNYEPLQYTIRFQNTGNDFARNVSITDALDQHLDLETFKLIGSSHSDKLQVIFEGDNVVRFDFTNIYLPDSTTNFDASNGFVSFRISAKEGIALKTQIDNSADIFFDFNPAVVTNTTMSILVEEYPSSSADDIDEFLIDIYPNPTASKVTFSKKVDKVTIFNNLGVKLGSKANVKELNMQTLVPGIYVLRIQIAGQIVERKILLQY